MTIGRAEYIEPFSCPGSASRTSRRTPRSAPSWPGSGSGSFLAFGIDALVVEVRAEVKEVGLGVRQQVPDDDQHGPADGHDGCLFVAAPGDAPVALAEEGVGFTGDDSSFTEDFGQPSWFLVTVALEAGAPSWDASTSTVH
jgi:hypothetical protein